MIDDDKIITKQVEEIHKKLNLDDAEDGDLIHADDEQEKADEDGYSIIAMWNWERKNYFIKGE